MRELTIANWATGLSQQMTPAQRNRDLAEYALVALAAAEVINRSLLGYVPAHTTKIEAGGARIIHDFQILDDVLRWIAQSLYDASPVLSGDYRRGHMLLADGVPVDVAGVIPPAREYCFTNVVPYARRIEVGKTRSGRSFVVQVEPRIYERVAKTAQGRFGNRTQISSAFVTPPNGAALTHNQPKRSFSSGGLRTSKRQHSDRASGSAITAPAIIVKGFGS